MNFIKRNSIFLFALASTSFSISNAMENYQTDENKEPVSFGKQLEQFKSDSKAPKEHPIQSSENSEYDFSLEGSRRDREIVLEILKSSSGNPFSYHELYKQLGRKIIDYIKAREHSVQDSKFIEEQFEKYVEDKVLNGPRLTWMSIQAAMILTPPDKRERSFKDAVAERITLLMKDSSWTKSYEKLQTYWHNFIEQIYESIFLLPVIGVKVYTPQFFLEGTAKNIYFICLSDEISNGVHGNIFPTPVARIFHDITHVTQRLYVPEGLKIEFHSQQPNMQKIIYSIASNKTSKKSNLVFDLVFDEDEKSRGAPVITQEMDSGISSKDFSRLFISPWLKSFSSVAQKVLKLSENENTLFEEEEKKKLVVFFFYTLQETDYNFLQGDMLSSILIKYNSFLSKAESFKNSHDLPSQEIGEKNALLFLLNKYEQQLSAYAEHYNTKEDFYNFQLYPLFLTFKSATPSLDSPYTDVVVGVSEDNPPKTESFEFKGDRQYEYAKRFSRDTYYLLVEAGILPKPTTPLGINYHVNDIRKTLQDLKDWIQKEYKLKGRLYNLFNS